MPDEKRTIIVQLNGERREFNGGLSLAALLAGLGVTPNQVAVEVNRQLAPRTKHADWLVADGDVLEIVTLVGGG